MVEIFADGESTGNIFFVQIKGTDASSKNDIISYQVKRAHLDYYNNIPNPVLFVIYSTSDQRFWAIWANALKDSLPLKVENQTTSLLNLSPKHVIDRRYFEKLPNTFSSRLQNKLNIAFSVNTETHRIFHKKLSNWLFHFYPDVFVVEHDPLAQSIDFYYNNISESSIQVEVRYLRLSHIKSEIDLSEKKFLFRPIDDFTNIPLPFANLLLFLSFLLVEKNLGKSVDLAVKCLDVYKGEIVLENLLVLCKKAARDGQVDKFQKLVQKLIETERTEEANFANFLLCSFTSNEDRDFYRQNLVSIINQTPDESAKGILSYNLANACMVNGNYHEASQHYQNARKFEPDYLNRHYWWREYGSVLFLTEHFVFAEWFYQKSIELGADKIDGFIMFALLADCQFLQGKFSNAEQNLELYFSEEESALNSYYTVKLEVCQFLHRNNLETDNLDRATSYSLMKEFYKSPNADKLNEAIILYPLNGIAWFNLGLYQMNDEQFEKAFTAFLVTICIQEYDKEAWRNCILLAFNLKENQRLVLLFDAAIRKWGISFVNYLAEHIYEDEHLNENQKIEIIDVFHKTANSLINN